MAGFEGISWAPGQMSYSLTEARAEMLEPRAGTYAVSRSIHYGICLAFEGVRFFVRPAGDSLAVVFLNLDHNLDRFREGMSFNLGAHQKQLVPSRDDLRQLFLDYLGAPRLRAFMTAMAETGAQGYLRPFTVDDEQSIGVTFPQNPVIRVVAARYTSYLGEPFHGVVVPHLVRVSGVNGNGRLKLGVNYLMSVKAVEEAQRICPGAASALFLDDRPYDPLEQRNITEWDSSCCLIALKNGTVVKIPESNLILPSVTIRGICAILGQLGVPVEERDMTYGELIERARKDEIVTVGSVGTAGILNRCNSLMLTDAQGDEIVTAKADPEHPLFAQLGNARSYYWDIYRGEADVPAGLVLSAHELG